MSARPRALDLFCGGGGVSVGLQRAGFDVTGVDIRPQPRYRGGTFIQADALAFPLDGYDFIWASPPCQAYTTLRARQGGKEYPELIRATRERLHGAGVPTVIENVPGAPLYWNLLLCGSMFGLRSGERWLKRHRIFECSDGFAKAPAPCSCKGRPTAGFYGDGGGGSQRRGFKFARRDAPNAMGIDWMRRAELSQAIPPAYAEWIGRQALAALRATP